MMFAGQDNCFESGILKNPAPLLRVKMGRIKDGRILITVPPFLVGKCVCGEMNKGILFQLMPGLLPLCRYRVYWEVLMKIGT